MFGEAYDVNVACLELLQTGLNTEKHGLGVVAGEVAEDRLGVVA